MEHPEDEEGAMLSSEVYWARRRAADRLACAIEGHMTDHKEMDDHGQAPCLRCGQWTYVD